MTDLLTLHYADLESIARANQARQQARLAEVAAIRAQNEADQAAARLIIMEINLDRDEDKQC